MTDESGLAAAAARATERLDRMALTDPQIAALVPDEKVTAALKKPGLRYAEVVATALAGYRDRPALGVRAYEVEKGHRHHLAAFTTITYGELAAQVEAIASAWQHDARYRVAPGEFVGFLAFSGAEMAAVDLACAYAQAISVPIQANLPAADALEVWRDTEAVALVASVANLATATDYVLRQETFRSLIVIDADERVSEERHALERARARLGAAARRVAFATFQELVAAGLAWPWVPLPPSPGGTDALGRIA